MQVSRQLDAREYKLLLNPARFTREPLQMANSFWKNQLRPIIAKRLDARSSGKSRPKGEFDKRTARRVRYLDTKNRRLADCCYILRERVNLTNGKEDDSSRQLMLRLRTPDLFVAAMAALAATRSNADTTFEEDIAPLEVAMGPSANTSVAIAGRKSIRSRFSLSSTRSMRKNKLPQKLGDLFALYTTLEDDLAGILDTAVPVNATLKKGPEIEEIVLRGAKVDLGQVDGAFAFTLWYFDPPAKAPAIVEISFKCDLDGGPMPRTAACRALELFIAMQEDLGSWVNLSQTSKTELALPS